MKKFILISFLFLSLASCKNSDMPVQAQVKTEESSVGISAELSRARMILESSAPIPEAKIEFSDPAMIAGSSFGNFFISMIRTQNYEMAIKFTSKGSIKKFGRSTLLNEYSKFDFDYKLAQKSMKRNGDSITMVYSVNEYGTAKLKKFNLVLENDSCKLVVPDNIGNLFKE